MTREKMSSLTSSSYQSNYFNNNMGHNNNSGHQYHHHSSSPSSHHQPLHVPHQLHHKHLHPCFTKKTPKRYFNLGLFCCCTSGFVFTFGLILMVWGSSPHEANAIWIAGIVFLFTGGFLFFMGIGSIGLYLSREDKRKRKEEMERGRARQYAASLASARSFARSSDVYLID